MESSNDIDVVAGDWLARRDSGVWSGSDQAAFEQWLNASTLHRVAFLRIEHAWEQALRLKALGAGVAAGKVPPAGQWLLSPFDLLPAARRRSFLPRALAAGIALVLAFGALGYFLFPAGASYRTPVGGVASVPMPDGSKITLNTDSEIRVSVTEKERRVNLEQGEAFFEVAHDPRRPFVVHAGDKRVIAVGTKFSVRRAQEEVRVIVTEGRVRVESDDRSTLTGGEPLAAGSVAMANADGVLLQYQSLPAAEESLSWRSGVLVFREMTLAAATAEFNRYNTRKIVIDDPDIAALRIAGSFRSTNADAFVRLLEQGYPLRADYQEQRIVLKGH